MGPEAATTKMMQCDHGDYKLLGQPYIGDDGQAYVTALRQLVLKKDDEIVCVQFPPKYDAARLKELIAQRGVEGAKLEEIYLDKEESHDNAELIALIKAAIGSFTATVYGGKGTTGGRQDVLLSSRLSLAYLRGLAKIGFHYHLWTSHIHTGAEFLFQPIRRFIQYGEGDWRSFVVLDTPRGATLRAYDKATGREVGEVFMPAPQTGSPMTYSLNGRQYIVVPVSRGSYSGEFIAFRLRKE